MSRNVKHINQYQSHVTGKSLIFKVLVVVFLQLIWFELTLICNCPTKSWSIVKFCNALFQHKQALIYIELKCDSQGDNFSQPRYLEVRIFIKNIHLDDKEHM